MSAHPPAGAAPPQQPQQPAQRPAQWLNVAPLPEAANACEWQSALMIAQLPQLPPEQAAPQAENAAWLHEVAAHVNFGSKSPILLMVFAQCVLDHQLRRAFAGALAQVDAVTAAALEANTG